MDPASDPELRRAVSDTDYDTFEHVRDGDLHGFRRRGDGTVLPLPWNAVYKNAWQTFLTALAARYGPNPAFVSIAVAGPTAASAEMILPNNNNSNNPQTQFAVGIAPNTMWIQLLAFHYAGMPTYLKSDQGFIDEWNKAIDMYGQIFSGVTLVATTGDGLPNFAGTIVTIPPAFSADCTISPDLDRAAETTILAYFVEPTVGGANAKATQTSGMEASRVNNGNLGVPAVKRLAQSTVQLTASAQILGGSQFNTFFSSFALEEGCTSTFPPDANDTPVGCSIPSTCAIQACIPVACIPQAWPCSGGHSRGCDEFQDARWRPRDGPDGSDPAGTGRIQRAQCVLRRNIGRLYFWRNAGYRAAQLSANLFRGHPIRHGE
jgi:hypothetical protein